MSNSETYLIYGICYSAIFVMTALSKRNKSNRLFDTKGILAINTGKLIALHVAGIICFGLIPFIFFKQSKLFSTEIPALVWLLAFFLLLIIIAITGFRTSRSIYIKRDGTLDLFEKIISWYFPARILFLCSYELFFRGFLLFDGIELFGLIPAIALSTGLTVLIHVFTNKKEMWGCIPFGIILCVFSIVFNSVWPSIVLHLALSLSYEVPPIYQFLKPAKLIK